jgi:hypothetical protein
MVNKRSLTYNRDAAFAFSYFSYTLSSSFLISQIMLLMQIDNLGILHDLNDVLELKKERSFEGNENNENEIMHENS